MDTKDLCDMCFEPLEYYAIGDSSDSYNYIIHTRCKAEYDQYLIEKSTSDDSHLAGDSKPSENKHFAGMAAEVTEGTSDDTHLADDSKRQENAPPVQEERRIANDGNSYTFREFLDYYGEEYGTSKWSAAQDTPPPAPPPQEIVEHVLQIRIHLHLETHLASA